MKKYNCENCGAEFESKKADKNRIPKFCSQKCCGEYKTIENSKKVNTEILTEKKCSKCGIIKPVLDFYKCAKEKNGLKSDCKECTKKHSNLKKDEKRKYDSVYRILNKEKLFEKSKKYALNNKSSISQYRKKYMKKYRVENKKEMNEKFGEYNKEYLKKYYSDNKDKINEVKKVYNNKRYYSDFNYNLRVRLRCRIKGVIKNHGGEKSIKTYDLLGCGHSKFVEYFTRKFTDGMTWDRFMTGEIHIDHIKPCALFDLTNIEEQKKCFRYDNLQPLWAKDNLMKGKKYTQYT